ncbi:hypothetical protein D3C87_1823660 [compost metagenome]
MGHQPSPDIVKERIIRTALGVAEVDAAAMTTFAVNNRVASGNLEIETGGETVNVAF